MDGGWHPKYKGRPRLQIGHPMKFLFVNKCRTALAKIADELIQLAASI
jgi:hypothetical protein